MASTQIGKLLQTWREAKGLSRRGAALKAGLGKSTLAYWEAGQRSPSVPELNALLDALNVSAAQRVEALSALNLPRGEQAIHRLEQQGVGTAPPCRSDLLRAMRLRAGLTQAETAVRSGVAQSAISRWERGADFPSHEHLHALCYVLGAMPEELVALTTGTFVCEDTDPDRSPNWDDWRAEHAVIAFGVHGASEDLRELKLLGFEARLYPWRFREVEAGWLLAHAYGWHAEIHRQRGWLLEARSLLQKLETLENALSNHLWTMHHVTLRAHLAVHARRQPAPIRGVRLLHDELANIPDGDTRAWAISEMALYLADLGDAERAVTLGQTARKLAQVKGYPNEVRLRSRDLANVLIHAGQHEHALSVLPETLSPHLDHAVREMQTRAAALIGLHRYDAAQEWLQRSNDIIEANGLFSLRAENHRLAGL